MGGSKGVGQLAEQADFEVGSTSVYLVVSDPDSHHDRAEKAGGKGRDPAP